MITPEERSEIGRKNRQRGHAKERALTRMFDGLGFAAINSKGSLGPIDVLGIPMADAALAKIAADSGKENEFREIHSKQRIRAVQIKSRKPTNTEMEEYREFAARLPNYIKFEVWIVPFNTPMSEPKEIIEL